MISLSAHSEPDSSTTAPSPNDNAVTNSRGADALLARHPRWHPGEVDEAHLSQRPDSGEDIRSVER